MFFFLLFLLRLDLHLGQAMLPDGDVGSDTILAVVEENHHAIGVHALSDEELKVLEVADDLLSIGLRTLFELGDEGVIGAVCLHDFLDLLHVACEIMQC